MVLLVYNHDVFKGCPLERIKLVTLITNESSKKLQSGNVTNDLFLDGFDLVCEKFPLSSKSQKRGEPDSASHYPALLASVPLTFCLSLLLASLIGSVFLVQLIISTLDALAHDGLRASTTITVIYCTLGLA